MVAACSKRCRPRRSWRWPIQTMLTAMHLGPPELDGHGTRPLRTESVRADAARAERGGLLLTTWAWAIRSFPKRTAAPRSASHARRRHVLRAHARGAEPARVVRARGARLCRGGLRELSRTVAAHGPERRSGARATRSSTRTRTCCCTTWGRSWRTVGRTWRRAGRSGGRRRCGGSGLAETVLSGNAAYLHDGRARTLDEAILWHGGEAEPAREAFRQASADDRAALIAYVRAL